MRYATTSPSGLPIQLIGTGRYVPSETIESSTFDDRWGLPVGTIAKECGVQRRHRVASGETSAAMGAQAVRRALDAAGLGPADLDCIVSAASVMQQAIPCLGSQIQAELGLGTSGIPAFDVNATCLGFLTALDLVAAAIAVGRYRTVAIVASEMPSVGLDPTDRATAPLFGDGAAAAVVTAAPNGAPSRLVASTMATYGTGGKACQLRIGGTAFPAGAALPRGGYFEMDGKAVYRLARKYLPDFTQRLLHGAGLAVGDLACVVLHQASGLAMDHMTSALGLPADRVVRILQRFGNQVAASLPNALHEAIASGRLERGDPLLMLGTGAGMALGGAVLVF